MKFGKPISLFFDSLKCPRSLQNSFHLLDRDQGRIIMDCVYLPPALETPSDLLDAPQPLQGRFPNIVSIYGKDDLRKTG